jgi:hypothetical protein
MRFASFFSPVMQQRFKVVVKKLHWWFDYLVGYIMPDMYSEPCLKKRFCEFHRHRWIMVDWKENYLMIIIQNENKLIDIFCQCFKLSGHELDLYFNWQSKIKCE